MAKKKKEVIEEECCCSNDEDCSCGNEESCGCGGHEVHDCCGDHNHFHKNFHHVMAGLQAQHFERRFERQGACAPESGADQFYRHGFLRIATLSEPLQL